MTICSISDCDRPVYVERRGWCSLHYNRWSKYGTPNASVSRIHNDDERRFWSKVMKTSDCWLWKGTTNAGYFGNRYGLFSVNSRDVMAHRYSYELLVGPIPDGLQIDHLCRQPLCVRPDHLEPVTQAENLRREAEANGHNKQRPCIVPKCDRGPHRGFGFCNMHFLRWKRSGRPDIAGWVTAGAIQS